MVDPGSPVLPSHSAALGLTLFAAIALPIVGDASVLDWLLAIGARDPIAAVFGLLTFGSPFLFGLAVAVAGLLRDRERAAQVIAVPLSFLHAVLVLHAAALVQAPRVPLRLSFIGFTAVACVYYLYAKAEADASDRPLGPRWLTRWGGVVLTGVTLWLHFQTFGQRPFGLALHVALAAAFLLAATTPRESPTH
ncbi:hypothetical protein SAMN02745121_04734 [Nannocystis exedens]|uniref:Uncharacterized protein n=1 Tax=Nannocystis exedens TaxID=54 RepID=A0A1I2BKG9_9BACT|nr:hypothetical protein [Nannocystis exedens]PCC67923.1 hypothetical protein NAEX_00931 [Nannocystis exedens]SFE56692.1 hypothetical protein SAMN02745121_04734 [Nannocystis exedens]